MEQSLSGQANSHRATQEFSNIYVYLPYSKQPFSALYLQQMKPGHILYPYDLS
jgi:hypothetical protein